MLFEASVCIRFSCYLETLKNKEVLGKCEHLKEDSDSKEEVSGVSCVCVEACLMLLLPAF